MNLSRRTKTAQSIVGYSAGRPDDDFYPTPPEATWALLNNHKFGSENVWELALLCKLSFLEGYRRTALLMEYPPARVLVFRKRLTMTRRGEPMRNGGMIAFAWFVWINPHDTKPTIDWI